MATRHASFRAVKTPYRWLSAEYGLTNSVEGMSAPILGKPIMPSLPQEQVLSLLESATNPRDKAIIAVLTESGPRLSELASVRAKDIDRSNRTIKVIGEGRKEALAPFGGLSEQ